jgi:hypothetical protein
VQSKYNQHLEDIIRENILLLSGNHSKILKAYRNLMQL